MFCFVGNLEQQCFTAAGPEVTSESVCVTSVFAMANIPADVVKEVDQIMASSEPVLLKVKSITKVLLKHGLAYEHCAKPSGMLVHPSNRSGQGLGHWDVWSKGSKLWQVGVRKQLLASSYAFELSMHPPTRASQIDANAKLVAQSGGLLAPLNGKERFLTVSSSHTSAWLKALDSGLTGPPEFQVQLKAGDLQSDSVYDLLQNGWEWVIISSLVEKQWKEMPAFLAMALNASNANQKQMSEVECASALAEALGLGYNITQAYHQVLVCDPACKSSLPDICQYVCKFGGGNGMPIVKFLSKFSGLNSLVCNFFHLFGKLVILCLSRGHIV